MMLHFIRHGDTLQSVADQINLENPLYIKEFHNQKCGGEDYIFEELVVGKKLFLPDNLTIQSYNSRNDASFKSPEKNPEIDFVPKTLDAHYKVNIKEISFDKGKKSENSFSYNFSLKWIKTEYNHHTFHISKSDFSNIKEKIGDLASSCMQLLNPIEIQTNLKGEIVTINLLKETIENFPKIKEKLLDQFPDKYAKIYIEEFEYVVLNQELFQKKMKQDWLLKTFFASIRNEFKNGKSAFKIFLENENSTVDIQQNGLVNDATDEVILNQTLLNDRIDIKFTGNYILSAQTGIIKSMNIRNSYPEYNILHTTELKVEKIS
jgi:hypothetical protein